MLADAREELASAHKYVREIDSAVKVLEMVLETRERPQQFRMIITRYLRRIDPFNHPYLLDQLSLNP